MADYLVTDTELTSIASAIRTKGGTSAQLTFPQGFVDAVGAIPTGGITPTGTKQISISASGTITEDVTNYANVEVAVPQGSAGTPTAVKGAVSNHSISVTPSVTNTTGFITGGTKSGTAATVSASELVSGTLSITENGTGIDVTNYANVDVNVSGGGGGGGSTTVTITGLVLKSVWVDATGRTHFQSQSVNNPEMECLSGSLIYFCYSALAPGEELTVSNAIRKASIDHGSRSSPRYSYIYQVN